ncbi:MAG: hypothetical protein ACFB51_03750 [Anaerolineae bacterium]
MSLPDNVQIGEGYTINANVLLGYRTGRPIEDHTLVIGPNATIRANTIIYGGTTIGSDLQTGHNVVIREQNTYGDGLAIWNASTIDFGWIFGSGV